MNTTALVLLDFINEIVHEGGKFAGKGYPAFVKDRKVLENVNAAIEKARKKNIPIIFVRVGFSQDYKEWPEHSPLFGAAKKAGALKLGTWATEIHDFVKATDSDFVVTKHRVSAFYATSLEAILRNLYVQASQMAQTAACNRVHEVEQRLARWLLILQDLVGGDKLVLTHEFLAIMLGTRRTTVTLAAGLLQKDGIIEYKRGKVHILDRKRLEAACCECYGDLREFLDSIVPAAQNQN